MRTYALSAQELSRRLVASAEADKGIDGGDAGAARAASERACRELSRSLGAAGFNALLTRALLQAEDEHPLLKDIRVEPNGDTVLGHMPEIVMTYGAASVATALEAMLAIMFGLLGRLIGDDMVPRLVERKAPEGTYAGGDVK
ncbi:MAG: hypothetical protein ABIT20_14715 [Gemmatimonadaceae bacterium]